LENLPTFNDIDENVSEDWLVDGLIPRGAITIMYGKGGLGKSHIVYLIGKCVVEGTEFFGRETKTCPVYYLDFENPASVQAHIKKICGGSNVILWGLKSKLGSPPRFDTKKEWEIYKTFPPGLIIIDTLRACNLLDTNSDKDMALIMTRFKELWACGHTVIVLLHTTKADERQWKGNTVIQDLSDNMVALFKVKQAGEITEDLTDDPNRPKLLFLGNILDEKSRFRKSKMYINFDPEHTIEAIDDPDRPSLLDINQRFWDWVGNENKEKGRKLEVAEYPNRTQFEKMVTGWGYTQGKAKKLVSKGKELRYWGFNEVKTKRETHHYYYPKISRQFANVGQTSVDLSDV